MQEEAHFTHKDNDFLLGEEGDSCSRCSAGSHKLECFLQTLLGSLVFIVLFVENLSSAAGAFQMYNVLILPKLISKRRSEEGSSNMDFL